MDAAENAIVKARAKAADRGLTDRAQFEVHDAFALGDLGQQFDTVTDCGLFHVFGPDEVEAYGESLRSALVPGGTYIMLGFSERDGRMGPSTNEDLIGQAFGEGWRIEEIRESTFESTDPSKYNHHALLAIVTRLD
ncbi:SAM-dependent methyltransferase [Haladaptatus sp. GCM10025707]|uniref:SAM-dependent methyltransferase n=1 Tax=unclassified Haladaptatus TaxID=2622732 RepID=UPI0023E8F1FE|nr:MULTISPECIES: class I SAM-dependent methyltransferase [unclassified Haladaptatus]